MNRYIFYLIATIFCCYSYGMEDSANISKMSGKQLETFIRNRGGYVKLSAPELALVTLRKRILNAANWDLPDAVNFLRGKKNHSRITGEEWNALCRVMDKTKAEIIEIYFSKPVSINQAIPLVITQSPKLLQPTVAEVDTWTPQQATEFMLKIKNPVDTKETSEEIWLALVRATQRSDYLDTSKNSTNLQKLSTVGFVRTHQNKIIIGAFATWAIAEACFIYKNMPQEERADKLWYKLPVKTAHALALRPIQGIKYLIKIGMQKAS